MKLANNIYTICKWSGYSMNQLARKFKVAPSTVVNWTRGKVPSDENMLKLSQFSGVPISDLYTKTLKVKLEWEHD